MNPKKEGWSAHDGYTAVCAQNDGGAAVNICMAEDLNDNRTKGVVSHGGKGGHDQGTKTYHDNKPACC